MFIDLKLQFFLIRLELNLINLIKIELISYKIKIENIIFKKTQKIIQTIFYFIFCSLKMFLKNTFIFRKYQKTIFCSLT